MLAAPSLLWQAGDCRMLLYRILEAVADELPVASDMFEVATQALLEEVRTMQAT